MCGRFLTDRDIKEMLDIYDQVQSIFGACAVQSGEICPTNNAPVFISAGDKLRPVPMKWGFPQYKGPGVIINARAETVTENWMFSFALQSRRCVIPSTGFYEWAHKDGAPKKQKYLFNLPGEDMLYMAGLFNEYENEQPRFVILTTEANDSMAPIHDRMPVILQRGELATWINRPELTAKILQRAPMDLVYRPAV